MGSRDNQTPLVVIPFIPESFGLAVSRRHLGCPPKIPGGGVSYGIVNLIRPPNQIGYTPTRLVDANCICLSLFWITGLVLFLGRVDEFVPHTRHVNLKIVGQTR